MTGDEITGADVQAQTDVLASVAGDLARDRTERKRANRLTWSAGTFALILAVVDLLGIGILIYSANQSARNGREIRKVLTVVDPQSPAGRQAAKVTAKTVELILIDGDCRNRRAIAHLPPPKVGMKCVLPPNN